MFPVALKISCCIIRAKVNHSTFRLMYLNRINNNDDNFIYLAPLNGYKEHHNKSM